MVVLGGVQVRDDRTGQQNAEVSAGAALPGESRNGQHSFNGSLGNGDRNSSGSQDNELFVDSMIKKANALTCEYRK